MQSAQYKLLAIRPVTPCVTAQKEKKRKETQSVMRALGAFGITAASRGLKFRKTLRPLCLHDARWPGPEIPFAVRTNTMKGFLRTVFAKGTFVGANHGFV